MHASLHNAVGVGCSLDPQPSRSAVLPAAWREPSAAAWRSCGVKGSRRTFCTPARAIAGVSARGRTSPSAPASSWNSLEPDAWSFSETSERTWVCRLSPLVPPLFFLVSLRTETCRQTPHSIREDCPHRPVKPLHGSSNVGVTLQVDAMELNSMDMPTLLTELGMNYDHERLAEAMRDRPWDLRRRALTIATTLGAFLTSLLQVYRAPAPAPSCCCSDRSAAQHLQRSLAAWRRPDAYHVLVVQELICRLVVTSASATEMPKALTVSTACSAGVFSR